MGEASGGAQDRATKDRLEKPHPNPKKKLVPKGQAKSGGSEPRKSKKLVPKFSDTPEPRRKAMYL